MDSILIVDDSNMNQVMLRSILADDYKTFCVGNANELFMALEIFKPSLILLDIVLPGMDGFNIIQRMRDDEELSKIPVIFITSLGDVKNEEKGFALGAVDYITKPFNENIVRARVKTHIQLYSYMKLAEKKGELDALTGLYNKATTEQLVRKSITAQKAENANALMIVDVDNFKAINDTFGHLYGDAVLTQLSKTLKQMFRLDDIVGRVGGDEFFVFLKNFGERYILENKAALICEKFNKVYTQNNIDIKISASIGISISKNNEQSYEELYKSADIALYNVKNAGKNDYSIYSGSEKMVAYKSTRNEIESEKQTNSKLNFRENSKDYIMELLYRSDDVKKTIRSVMQLVCEKYNFNRVYIGLYGKKTTKFEIYEKWEDEIASMATDSIDDLTHEYTEWVANRASKSVSGIMTLSEEFFKNGHPNFAKSGMIFGFSENSFNGFIGFDECEKKRSFSKEELEDIEQICKVMELFIKKQYLEEMFDGLEGILSSLFNSHKNMAFVVNVDSLNVVYANEYAKAMCQDGRDINDVFDDFKNSVNDFPSDDINGVVHVVEIYDAKSFKDYLSTTVKINWIDGKEAYFVTIAEVED